MTKSEYDLLKNALNKNYKIVYEIEKDIERHVTGRLLNYNGGNVVLLNEDKNELYHIPFSGLKWLLPAKEKNAKEN